jgi:hypothetical protein
MSMNEPPNAGQVIFNDPDCGYCQSATVNLISLTEHYRLTHHQDVEPCEILLSLFFEHAAIGRLIERGILSPHTLSREMQKQLEIAQLELAMNVDQTEGN